MGHPVEDTVARDRLQAFHRRRRVDSFRVGEEGHLLVAEVHHAFCHHAGVLHAGHPVRVGCGAARPGVGRPVGAIVVPGVHEAELARGDAGVVLGDGRRCAHAGSRFLSRHRGRRGRRGCCAQPATSRDAAFGGLQRLFLHTFGGGAQPRGHQQGAPVGVDGVDVAGGAVAHGLELGPGAQPVQHRPGRCPAGGEVPKLAQPALEGLQAACTLCWCDGRAGNPLAGAGEGRRGLNRWQNRWWHRWRGYAATTTAFTRRAPAPGGGGGVFAATAAGGQPCRGARGNPAQQISPCVVNGVHSIPLVLPRPTTALTRIFRRLALWIR